MVNITTPVGRIVWGNPLIAKQRRDDNNKPKLKFDGTPDMVYSFGLAVSKAEAGAIFQAMQTEAQGVYPSGAIPADFAWKYQDGDGMDKKGKPFAQRTGYVGCVVIAVESGFPINTVQLVNGSYSDMTQGVKTGDYVMVNMDIVGHGVKPGVRMSKPGLYINPRMARFIGFGEEISNAPNAEDVFGAGEVALPPGASATPVATLPQSMPAGLPGTASPGMAPGVPSMPSVAPAPAHDFVANAGLPGATSGLPGATSSLPGATSGLPGMPR
jgi:hypothetical protein